MNRVSTLQVPVFRNVHLSLRDPSHLELRGTITAQDPANHLGVFLRALHDAVNADRLRALEVDVSGLSFVNSSAIRLFIDWIQWMRNDSDQSYKLKVLTNSRVAWQKTSFAALTSLAGDLLEVRQVE
jgi:hypothetical protein